MPRQPPHLTSLVSVDFILPTIRFQVLYVFLVLADDFRRILHFNVTADPSAQWTQQLREAFPFENVSRHVLRDRAAIFGAGSPARIRKSSFRPRSARSAGTVS
jgi:hypothetical protein